VTFDPLLQQIGHLVLHSQKLSDQSGKSYKTVIVRFAFAQAVPMSDSKLQSSKILQ